MLQCVPASGPGQCTSLVVTRPKDFSDRWQGSLWALLAARFGGQAAAMRCMMHGGCMCLHCGVA
eukprot:1526439-Alexandrium_andersonii.AAC.1